MSVIDPENAVTRMTLRIRFCETDLMGIVHHANYLQYFEAGRVEWLRRRGVTYVDWAARSFHLPVVEANVRYKAPARFDDLIDVETRLVELRHVSLRFDYRLFCGDKLLADGFTRLACVDDAHALTRFTDDMLEMLTSAEHVNPSPPSPPGAFEGDRLRHGEGETGPGSGDR